jgi:hypothetical protein
VLSTPLPIELNDDLRIIGDVYRYALKDAFAPPCASDETYRVDLTFSANNGADVGDFVSTAESH